MAGMRALRIITAAVLIAGIVYVSIDFWAPLPARFLIRTDPLESAEVIVVLAGDGSGLRVEEAVRLLAAGWAPSMIVNGSFSLYESRECDLGREYAIERGADADAVEAFCMAADSTADEARLLDRELRDRQIRRALVVTSDFHTRRAGDIFRRAASGQVEYAFAASPTVGFDAASWWRTRPGREVVVIEWIKTLNSWVERVD